MGFVIMDNLTYSYVFWMSGIFYDWDTGTPLENQDYSGRVWSLGTWFKTGIDKSNGERFWNVDSLQGRHK